jgi:hypothetical protein
MLPVTHRPVSVPETARESGAKDLETDRRPATGGERPHDGDGRCLALVGLAGITVASIGARYWGLLYGLPYSYYPDESSVVGDALRMAVIGDPRPAQFLWPTLWIYILALVLKLGTAVGLPPAWLSPLGDPSASNSLYVYGVARATTALTGVLTIPALYAVAVQLFALLRVPGFRWLALLPAGFLALSPLHVQHSHVTSPDVPTTFFLVLSVYAAIRILATGTSRWYLLAGLMLGVAAGIKYPSALFAVGVVAAHLGRSGLSWRRPLDLVLVCLAWRLWLAGTVTLLVFFVTSPYILIDWQRFIYDFSEQAERHLRSGPVGEVGLTGAHARWLYVPLAMQWGLDTPVALLGLAGVAVTVGLALRRSPQASLVRWLLVVLLIFPLMHAYFTLSWQHRYARYVLSLIPFCCLLAGLGLYGVYRLLTRQLSQQAASRTVAAVGIAAMLWQADGVVRYDLFLTRTDTRTIAAQWMEVNLPPGEEVIVEWYGPPYRHVRQAGFDLSDRPLDRYLGRTPRFIAVSSFTYDRWMRSPERYARRAAFYTGLHDRATLLYEIRPHPELPYDPVQEGWDGWHGLPLTDDVRPGPVIRLYQVSP